MPVEITLLCALLEGGLVENETVNKTSDLCVIMTVSYVYRVSPHSQYRHPFDLLKKSEKGLNDSFLC